jgi:hypothetical protein
MSVVEQTRPVDARQHFIHALRRVLRPIIRFMIRAGIGYDDFVDVARGAYVESAVRDGIGDIQHPTRDQIAKATGIDRRRIDHYIDDDDALPTARSTLTPLVVELLHRWHTDPRYLQPSGIPCELSLNEGSAPRFQDLVRHVDVAADPEAMLTELLRASSVIHTDENRVRALTRYFLWQKGSLHSIEDFGLTLSHLAETLEYNMERANTETKRLERSVFTDRGLPAQLLPNFEAYAQERTSHFLLDLDDWLARASDLDPSPPEARIATSLSVFLYIDPRPDPRPVSSLIQGQRHTESATFSGESP